MKIATENREVGRMGTGEERQFSIAGSAKAFKILSDGLYSDKIGAVIRELSCNAKDAHVDAGKGDVPFEIHLPNALEPWFAVTDNGIGLCHEDVMHLYSTYFESTKTDSNDVTGCLGLGSKSPFAYVDAFTVESRWNGTMTMYSCFYNEDGIPSITVLAEPFDTDQPNGLTIKMPVKDRDMREFGRKAEASLRRFDPAPIVTGDTDYSVKTIEYRAEGTTWKMLADDNPYGESKIHAIQGNVTYPIDRYALGDLTTSQSAIMELSADIFFNIGDLDVAANREALGYDDSTIANIKAALDVVIAELPPMFQDKFNDCKTLWEARILFQDVIKDLPRGLRSLLADSDIGLKWHKQPLNEPFKLEPEDFPLTIIKFQRGFRSNRGSILSDSYGNGHKFTASNDILFFYDDVGHGSHSRLTHYVENTTHADFRYAYLIKTDAKKDLKKYSKALGSVTIQPVSNLSKRPKVAQSEVRVTSKVLLYKGSHFDRRDSWEPTDLDLKTGGIYVMINRFKVYNGDYEVSNFDETVVMAAEIDIIDTNTTPIYGIRKGDITKLKDDSGWVNFYDLIKTSIKDLIVTEQIASVLADYTMFNTFNFDLSNNLTELRDAGFAAGTAMGDFLTAYDYLGKRKTERATSLTAMATRVSYRIDETTPKYDLYKLWEAVVAQYPLVDLVDTQKMRGGYYSKDGAREKNFSALMDYIAAIDLIGADAVEEEAE